MRVIALISAALCLTISLTVAAEDAVSKAEVLANASVARLSGMQCAANWQTGRDTDHYKGVCRRFWNAYGKLSEGIEAYNSGKLRLSEVESNMYKTDVETAKVQAEKIKLYQQ